MPLTPTGFVPNTPEQELIAIQEIFYKVFGINADMTVGNPTSAFIQELANMGINVENSLSLLYSDIYNPQNASGVFLDGLCEFNGLRRNGATPTVVTCVVTGLNGTTIPIGSKVLNQYTGDIYVNPNPITIPISGVVNNAIFIAQQNGAISAPANSITVIQQNIAGWSSVNNPTAGATGSARQNDTSLRNTRSYTLALNSVSWYDALASAIENFLNQNGQTETNTGDKYVQGYFIFENFTDLPIPLPGTTDNILPQSVYITIYAPNFLFTNAVQNAVNASYVAGIILRAKSAGCQTQNVQTSVNAFSVNYTNPKFTTQTVNIKFDSPIAVPIQFNITIQTFNTTVPTLTIKQNIANAILSQFYNGFNTYPPINMYENIVASSFIPTIVNAVGNCNVTTITIQNVTSGTPAQIYTALPPTQIPTLSYFDVFNNIVITS